MFYNEKSRPVNFCRDQLILKLIVLIGEWNQNLSEKTVSENLRRRFIRRLEVSQGLYMSRGGSLYGGGLGRGTK